MNTKICLITGATGFIGQHVVVELVRAGYKIIGIDKPDNAYCAAVFNDQKIRVTANIPLGMRWFENTDMILKIGDIADKMFMEKLFKEIGKNKLHIDFVLHFAACATIQQAIKEKEKTWQTNYLGTMNILENSLEYFRKYPEVFKGFFYASTDKVYGEGSSQSYHETDALKPLPYPYDLSKAKADMLVRQIAALEKFPAVIYRFCNVYGPGDYHISRIVPGTLYRLIHKNEEPILKTYRDKEGTVQSFYRDMIYIKDLTHAIHMLLQHMETYENRIKLIGEVFNLGTENSYPMQEVIGKIMSYSGASLKAKEEIVPQGEIKKQCMNYAKLNSIFGFKPEYDLERGLKETVRWYVSHKGETNDKFN